LRRARTGEAKRNEGFLVEAPLVHQIGSFFPKVYVSYPLRSSRRVVVVIVYVAAVRAARAQAPIGFARPSRAAIKPARSRRGLHLSLLLMFCLVCLLSSNEPTTNNPPNYQKLLIKENVDSPFPFQTTKTLLLSFACLSAVVPVRSPLPHLPHFLSFPLFVSGIRYGCRVMIEGLSLSLSLSIIESRFLDKSRMSCWLL